jgi:hypothetical protein
MAASAPCGRAAPAFRVTIDPERDSDGPIDLCPGRVGGIAEEIGACTIECDRREVTLAWSTLERSRQRLLAGADVIGAFARTHSSGLYR